MQTVFLLYREEQYGQIQIGGIFSSLQAAGDAAEALWPWQEPNPFRPFQWGDPEIQEMEVRD